MSKPAIPPSLLDRRTTLKGLGAMMAAGCAPSGPKPGADDGNSPLDSGDAAPTEFGWPLLRHRIDTVVVLCMENRSFDHYFGALKLLEQHEDVEGLTEDMSNALPDGTAIPPFLSDAYCVSDPPHSWNSSRDQWNDGANDGFVTAFHNRDPDAAHEAMGYFDRTTLSAFYELSDHYTLCDQWFGSLLSSTWPNRFYLHCADNGGQHGNSFPTEPVVSIYDRLTHKGLSWGCYFANVPFLMVVPDRQPDEPQFMEVEQFFADAAAGALPNMVVVDPIFGRADDHPPAHPVAGQIYAAQIYEALRNSPQWERCLFVITYDEHGGFFDHVPPPELPDDRAAEGFGQAGFRVPTLLVGPWVKPGHVSHVVRDHTSILAFVENLFEVDALRMRDAAADPMLEVFDEAALLAGTPREGVALTPIDADEDEIFAAECVTTGGILADGPTAPVTGQPELEAWIDAQPVPLRVDRRLQTDALHRALVAQAEKDGLVTIRRTTTSGL